MEYKQIKASVEAMLFAYAEPVSAQRLSEALEVTPQKVEAALEELKKQFSAPESGICLLHLADRWQLGTKQEFADPIARLMNTKRKTPLSPAAMETLTVIAYNQPVSRAFIEQVRGVDSSSSVSGLLEKGLIEEAGRLELPGHPVSFRTTDVFLRSFGLATLADLPPLHAEEAPPQEQPVEGAMK